MNQNTSEFFSFFTPAVLIERSCTQETFLCVGDHDICGHRVRLAFDILRFVSIHCRADVCHQNLMEQTHPSVFFVRTRTTLPLSTDTHISLHEPSDAATDPTVTKLICVTPLPLEELREFADNAPSSVKLNYFLSLRPLPARELHRLSLYHSFCFNILLPWDNSFRNTCAFRQIETSQTGNCVNRGLS